jgi:hypothetical protein
MFTRFALPLAALALCNVLAPTADAGQLGVQIHGKKVSVGLQIGGHEHAPRPIGYSAREWVPAHWTTVCEKVWVAGREECVWVAPVYQTHYDHCGRPIQVCVRAGHWETICTPGHYETRERQVWVAGGWRVKHCG